MARQLRAIGGPLAGAIWLLKHRTRIGRAADSEVQIIHDGVSRQHAQIVELGPDEHEIIDLQSNNGTWVDDRRIRRCRLIPGSRLRLVGGTFVYEEALPESQLGTAEVYAVKVTSGRTLRRTMSVLGADRAAHPTSRETCGDGAANPEPVGGQVRSRSERFHLVAQRSDGSGYEGNIITDVIEYRELRLRQTRGELRDPVAQRRYTRLQSDFTQPVGQEAPHEARRHFLRYRVAFPARLRHGGQSGESTSSVMVIDLGAGGARVACPSHEFRVADLAWLVVDLDVSGRLRTYVFTSRVVRLYENDQLGLIFAGAPEWENWRPER